MIRRAVSSVLLTAVLASVAPAFGWAQTDQRSTTPADPYRDAPVATFKAGAEAVSLTVAVRDQRGRTIHNLKQEQFEVFDSGANQPIRDFYSGVAPISLAVLLDISGSMAGNLALLRAASTALIGALGPNDLAKFGAFGEEITIGPRFTRDAGELLRSLPTFIPQNAPTPLWEAADKAMADLATAGGEGRPVVLIMSDGKDSPPPMFRRKWFTQLDVAERAEREDVMLYGIGVYSRMMPGGDIRQQIVGRFPDPGLGTVAEDSGGGYDELRPRDDLGAEFARIADELHHQYLLGFAPPARDGKTHKIEVKAARKDVKVRARKAYKAAK